jgi:large subunit ribosomal protein L9
VDNLGIVGDVVKVRTGYARNYLLPREMATEPSDEAIQAVAERRAEAEREVAALRKEREGMCEKIDGLELTIQRSCNDQGLLYAQVTQQDIARALDSLGYAVRPREVRIPQTIKRIDTYEVAIKFDADLGATIKLWVVADRKIDEDEREEMEFDNEGNLIEKPAKRSEPEAGTESDAAAPMA